LIIPETSAGIERAFSTARLILNDTQTDEICNLLLLENAFGGGFRSRTLPGRYKWRGKDKRTMGERMEVRGGKQQMGTYRKTGEEGKMKGREDGWDLRRKKNPATGLSSDVVNSVN